MEPSLHPRNPLEELTTLFSSAGEPAFPSHSEPLNTRLQRLILGAFGAALFRLL